jgi:hypothetical protein
MVIGRAYSKSGPIMIERVVEMWCINSYRNSDATV